MIILRKVLPVYPDKYREEDWKLIRSSLTSGVLADPKYAMMWAIRTEEDGKVYTEFVDMLLDAMVMLEEGIALPEDPPL